MIKIFIALILAYSINSNFETCIDELDPTKCEMHDDGINNGYCYTIKNPGIPDEDGKIEDDCIPLPDNAENQQIFWKLFNGYHKEFYLFGFINDEEIQLFEPKKDYYKKGETVEVNQLEFTEAEKAKVNKNNTCSYHHVGKLLEYIEAVTNGEENRPNVPFPNITDKNVCFGAEKFNELKNLLNCGYANFKLYDGFKTITFNTCFYMPDKQMPDGFLPHYKEYFVDGLMFEEDLYSEAMDETEAEEDVDVDFKKSFRLGHKKRKLSDIQEYEITIEDKYGKIIQFVKNSTDVQILEEGNQTDSDREQVDDEPSKIKTSSSDYSKLNMALLLSFILLVI